jgi:hypothetical protein
MQTKASQGTHFHPLSNTRRSLRARAGAALVGGVILASLPQSEAATRYVSLSGTHVPPFESWDQAATNIQAAIDIAVVGDEVLVTNGVYATGGKVMSGDLTNRIAIDKAIIVRSVNGPQATEIRGAGVTNGPAAVRCAWLSSNATLIGFTVHGGATRQTGAATELTGGGVWCENKTARIENCHIIENTAAWRGGGAFQGSFLRCRISKNVASANNSEGGGIYSGIANACEISENTVKYLGGGFSSTMATNCSIFLNAASTWGGGASYGVVNHCNVVDNTGTSGMGGVYQSTVINSIVYRNTPNSSAGSFLYSCTVPAVGGPGNIGAEPQLLPDRTHLASTSPCRGAGTNIAGIVSDIDGQAWSDPPSIGCDEWKPAAVVTSEPTFELSGGRSLVWTVACAGEPPFACWWFKDGQLLGDGGMYSGASTSTLMVQPFDVLSAGTYQVVASNSFGVSTSLVAKLSFHFVNPGATASAAPFTSWETAATNIQDAIEAAAPGTAILVTNGVYSQGGKVMAGDLTNRIAIYKPLTVYGFNGPLVTHIQGTFDPATNGPAAVRCAWLTNKAALVGFTLRGGATRKTGASNLTQAGGAWCSSASAIVSNCRIVNNASALDGAAIYGGFLRNCLITGNYAGGASGSVVNQCTILANSGTGATSSSCTNSILYDAGNGRANYTSSVMLDSCCTTPLPEGSGNITNTPGLVDGIHLAENSPCRGQGRPGLASGRDIDGHPWANPPSIGCDEFSPYPNMEPVRCIITNTTPGFTMSTYPVGALPLSCTWLRNGIPVQEDGLHSGTGSSHLRGKLSLLEGAAYQFVVTNAFGAITSAVVTGPVIHFASVESTNPVPPFLSWSHSATTIQDAIDAALPGEIILVGDGLYATGGKNVGFMQLHTNRVALDKVVYVESVSGPGATIIEGARHPGTTNGLSAMRCAWLTNGAMLSGFTLRLGATRGPNAYTTDLSGGGAFCERGDATVHNCLLLENTGVYQGAGASGVRLIGCILSRNAILDNPLSGNGGGAWGSTLENCVVSSNSAPYGAGVSQSKAWNCAIYDNVGGAGGVGLIGGSATQCTIFRNRTNGLYAGGVGVKGSYLTNCIVFQNSGANVDQTTAEFTCTDVLLPGLGNLAAHPQLIDPYHLSSTSPCIAAGKPGASTGTDLDGEPWTNPPSIGCDEYVEAGIVGPIDFTLGIADPIITEARNTRLYATLTGRANRVAWDFGDGSSLTNLSLVTVDHAWTNPGDYTITFTAYNLDNPAGVSKTIGVTVIPLVIPALSNPTWSTNAFTLEFQTQPGVTYQLQQTTNLASPAVWSAVKSIVGNGNIQTLTDTAATNQMRFYRLWLQ